MRFMEILTTGFAFALGMEIAIGVGTAIGHIMRKRGRK